MPQCGKHQLRLVGWLTLPGSSLSAPSLSLFPSSLVLFSIHVNWHTRSSSQTSCHSAFEINLVLVNNIISLTCQPPTSTRMPVSCDPVLCYLLERASSSQTCPKHTVMSICMHARWPVEEGNPVSRVEERHNTLLESASVQVTYFSSPSSPIRTVLPRKLNVQLGHSINDIHKYLCPLERHPLLPTEIE